MNLGEAFYTEDDLKNHGFKKLGKNVRIKKNVGIFFTENVSIDDNVRIDDFTIIVAGLPGCKIGSHVHIASHCYLAGSAGIVLEDFSGLSPGVMIFSGSDDYSGEKLTNPTVPRKYIGGKSGTVILERHVIIGAGSIILPGCVLGVGASVGAMSLVTKSLEPWGIYAGVPARRIRERKKNLLVLEEKLLREERNE